MDEQGKRFLDRFPVDVRSSISNRLLNAIRGGETDPKVICSRAFQATARQARYHPERIAQHLDIFRENIAEALECARYYVEYENVPAEEKARRKEAQAEEGRREYMRTQAPTQKQIDTLKKLGHEEVPGDRLEASDLIQELKTW